MPVLDIVKLGEPEEPILHGRALEIEDISDPAIQTLIDDMIETCKAVKGVGIAAPQVNQPLRLFILSSQPSERYPAAPLMEHKAIINPILISSSVETEMEVEGCLSIPGLLGIVKRPRSVTVSYTNRYGGKEEESYEGFIARVFMHEFDHLNGVLYLAHTKPEDLKKVEVPMKPMESPDKSVDSK